MIIYLFVNRYDRSSSSQHSIYLIYHCFNKYPQISTDCFIHVQFDVSCKSPGEVAVLCDPNNSKLYSLIWTYDITIKHCSFSLGVQRDDMDNQHTQYRSI